MKRLSSEEALRIAVGEEARARAMDVIGNGGELVMVALHLREAAEAYRLVADQLHRRAVEEAREAGR